MMLFKNIIVLLSIQDFYAHIVIEKKEHEVIFKRSFVLKKTKNAPFLIINFDRVGIFFSMLLQISVSIHSFKKTSNDGLCNAQSLVISVESSMINSFTVSNNRINEQHEIYSSFSWTRFTVNYLMINGSLKYLSTKTCVFRSLK